MNLHSPVFLIPEQAAAYAAHPWHEEIARFTLPEAQIQEMPDAFVTAGRLLDVETASGAVYGADGELHPASLHLRRRRILNPSRERIAAPRNALSLRGTWLYLGWGFAHHGHMLLEGLARAWSLKETAFEPLDGILMHWHGSALPPATPPLLAMLGLGEQLPLRWVQRDTRVQRLLLPGQRSVLGRAMGEEMQWVYGQLRAAARNGDEDERARAKRLYVSRRLLNTGLRRLIGEERIEQAFTDQGFRVVHPQLLTLCQQIRLFSQAEAIAGCEGSGLHNVLFADRPGTLRVLGCANRIADVITQSQIDRHRGWSTEIVLTEAELLPIVKHHRSAYTAEEFALKLFAGPLPPKSPECLRRTQLSAWAAQALALAPERCRDPMIPLRPADQSVWARLLAAHGGDTAAAEREWEETSAFGCRDPRLALGLARHLLKAGDRGAAARWAERAVTLEPDSPNALRLLGQLRASQSEWSAAAELLQRAQELAPRDVEFLKTITWSEFQSGNLEAAEFTALRARASLPGDPVPLAHLARIAARRGDFDGALAWIREALAHNPDNEHYQQLQAQWQEAAGSAPG